MATAKRGTTKKQDGDGGAGKKQGTANPAFMKPLTPSRDLAAVVGKDPLPRTEATKRIWAYIKEKDLQDPANRRMINADAKLRPVFGGQDQVSMFEMTKLMNAHLK